MTLHATNFPLIIDSFAGGGGASTGIELALGRSPDLAINHNPVALAMHEANHPDTLHLSENVYKVDPLDYLRGRHIGLAWFSPDCKHFSKAKGGKPVERNIRDLAWIIPGWIERIQKSGGKVDVMILENVEEFQEWGPLVETDGGLMPCPENRGATFQKWCRKIRSLGGKLQHRELRGCDYGAPTIRKRLFVIARFDGRPIVWPKATHGKPDNAEVIAGRMPAYPWVADCIDWSRVCPSIFDTAAEIKAKHQLAAIRPLADATMSRVARGVHRYVLAANKPFLVSLTHHDKGDRCEDIEAPANTITGANRGEKALVVPSIVGVGGRAAQSRPRSAGEPLHTGTSKADTAIITPSIIKFNGNSTGHAMDEPTHAITANSFDKKPGGAAPLGIIAPVLSYAQQGGGNRPANAPAHTFTASAKDQNTLVAPYLVPRYGEREGQEPRTRPVTAPGPTIVPTSNEGSLAAVYMAQHNTGLVGHSVAKPMSTMVQKGCTQSVVAAFVSRQFGTSIGHGADEPSHTATAEVNKSALVAPFLTKYYGTEQDAGVDGPAPTATTRARFGYVHSEIAPEPLTDAQLARARDVADFLRAHGFWDEREVVTLTIDGVEFVIIDIGMRMLTPRELFCAQGFPADYIIDLTHEGRTLTKSEQIACCGNSVCPPVAEALVGANCGHLAAVRVAA